MNKRIEEEKQKAIAEHGFFKNMHECESVLREELEECLDEIEIMIKAHEMAWKRHVKSDDKESFTKTIKLIERHAEYLIDEAVQVASVCKKWRQKNDFKIHD